MARLFDTVTPAPSVYNTGMTPTGSAPTTLEQSLGQSAQTQMAQVNDAYTQQRRQLIGQQAAQGRVGSGVSDYPMTDLDTQQMNAQSGVASNLENSLGQIPAEDWANQLEYQRNLDLAKQMASYYKPTDLENIFGGISSAAPIAGAVAAMA